MSRRTIVTIEYYDIYGNLERTEQKMRTIFVGNDAAGNSIRYINHKLHAKKPISKDNVVRFYRRDGKRRAPTLTQMVPGIDDNAYT